MSTPASPIWRPSSARVVVLDDSVPVPRGSQVTTPRLLAWPPKDPADVLDYVFDVSAALAGNDGDNIASLDVTVNPSQPGDLTLVRSGADGRKVVLWLSAGQPNTAYTVTVSIVTGNGRSFTRTILLPVIALATVVAPPSAIDLETGLALTDQNGAAVLSL